MPEANKNFSGQEIVETVLAYVRGMWRFRWPAVIVAWLLCLTLWVFIAFMPPIYQAGARIYVDTENAIRPLLRDIAISSNVMDEIRLVTNEMLSRPNLADVARETDLDLKVRNEQEFEGLLASLQRRISVNGAGQNIYSIQFEDADRDKAIAVVRALVNTFVERSLGGNRTETDSAQEFLQEQIAEYEKRLVDAETRLADFKRQNVAFMPDQSGDYFARLQGAQIELQTTREALRIAEQRQAELQRQLVGEEPVFGILPDISSGGSQSSASAQIRQLEGELERLRLQYTDKHPRIGQINETISMLRRQESSTESNTERVINPLDVNPVYQSMRIQLSTTEVEIASLRTELQQKQSIVSRLRNQVDTIPQVEAKLNSLNRDYGVVQAKYEQLLQQLETANIGEDVDESIDDVQFRIIDPPFAKFSPVGPNRVIFIAASFIVAVGAALALTFGLNLLRPTFYGARNVTSVTGLPVIGSVSHVRDAKAKSKARWSLTLFSSVAVSLLAVFISVLATADRSSDLIRSVAERLLW